MTETLTYKKSNTIFTFGTAIGGCIYGYNIGAISGVLLMLKKTMFMTTWETSFFVSAFLWGIASALICAGYMANLIGRKKLLIIGASFTLTALIFILMSNNIIELIIFRFLMGASVGILNVVIPLYIAETISAKYRGRALVAYQLSLSFGILLATFVSYLVYSRGSWKLIFVIEFIPACLLLIFAILITESPRWLLIKQESQKIKHSPLKRQSNNFDKKQLLPLLFVILIASLNQLTGINAFLQYDSMIFVLLKFRSHDVALFGSIIITGINFLMTIFAMFIVDKIERRKLLQIGLAGICMCLLAASILLLYINKHPYCGVLVIICFVFFVIFFAIGPGALVWTFLPEMLPTNIRSIGIAIALSFSSISGAIITSVFLPVESFIGLEGVFLVCLSFVVIYLVLSCFIPNTRGLSLENINSNTEL